MGERLHPFKAVNQSEKRFRTNWPPLLEGNERRPTTPDFLCGLGGTLKQTGFRVKQSVAPNEGAGTIILAARMANRRSFTFRGGKRQALGDMQKAGRRLPAANVATID